MKRTLCLGVALAFLLSILLIPGCAQRSSTATPKEDRHPLSGGASDASSQPEDLSTAPDVLPSAPAVPRVQEYGKTSSYVALDGSLTVRVNYPAGDIAALDEAITDWAVQTADAFRAELQGNGNNGSFSANYDSYEVNGRVVSVLVSGTLSYSHANLPQSVSATFNADRLTGQVLALTDLLCAGGEDTLRTLAAERAGMDPATAGADFLSQWLLTASGLKLFLPGKDGQSVEFTYEELMGVLSLPAPERVIDPSKPMIALTFDDGPSSNTGHILDLLALYGGKATFFVVGNRVSSYADTARRTAEEGHEIGIHTWDHSNLTKLSTDQIKAEILDTQTAVQQYAGATCAAVRPPGGAVNDTVKATAGELGFFLTNWSIDPEDWKTRDADSTYNVIMSQAADGAIVLCHDLYSSTAEAMDRVIPELIAQGYQLVTVSELLSYSEGGIVPGQLYRHR